MSTSGSGSFIVYAIVAYEDCILARSASPLEEESPSFKKDVEKIATWMEKVLRKIVEREEDHKKTLVSGKFSFHYMMSKGLVYMCVTPVDHPQKVAFSFLRDIRHEWNAKYGRFESARAQEDDMTVEFAPVLQKKMVYYSDQTTSLVKEALEKVEEVKGVMLNNVDKVLARGENLTTIEFKAKEVQAKGGSFKKQAITLKHKKWWTNLKWRVYFGMCCALLAVVLFYLIGALVCGGWRWDNCTDWIFTEIFGV